VFFCSAAAIILSAPPPAAMASSFSGGEAFEDFVSFTEGMDSQLDGLAAYAEEGPPEGLHVASPISPPEQPAEAPCSPKRPVPCPKTPETPPNPGMHTTPTPPWRLPQKRIAPPVSAGHAHPAAIDWNNPAVIEIEKAITFEYGKKFKDRGPPPPDQGGPTTWRGQVFRESGNRWGNRGGKNKEAWNKFFSLDGGKGSKKGNKGGGKGWSGKDEGSQRSSEGGGSSSSWSHGQNN